MRKKRALLSGLLILCLFIALVRNLNLFEFNEGLRKAILLKASPKQGSLTLGKAQLGFFSLHLRGVHYETPDALQILDIQDIKISLNPGRLIRNRFKIGKSINRIEIIGPLLTFNSFHTPVLKHSKPAASAAVSTTQTTAEDSDFPVDSLIVRAGTVVSGNSTLGFLKIRNIRGAVHMNNNLSRFRLSGEFLNTGENMSIQGVYSRDFQEFNFDIQLNHASLREPLQLPGGLSLESAHINLVLYVMKNSALPATSLTGTAALDQARIRLADSVFISDITGRIKIENDTVKLDSLTGKVFGRRFLLAGLIRELADPRFELNYHFDALSLAHHDLQQLTGLKGLKGQLALDATLQGRLDSLALCGSAVGHNATWGEVTFKTLLFETVIQSGRLSILRVDARLLDGLLSASGEFSSGRTQKNGFLNLTGEHLNLLQFLPPPFRQKPATFGVTGKVLMEEGKPKAKFLLSGSSVAFPNIKGVQATIRYENQQLRFDARNSDGSLLCSGEAALAGKKEIQIKLTGKRLDLSLLSDRPREDVSDKASAAGEIILSGTPQTLRLNSRLAFSGYLADGPLQIHGVLKEPATHFSAVLNLTSDSLALCGVRGPFSCRLVMEKETFRLENLRFVEDIRGRFAIEKQTVSGFLNIDHFEIQGALDRESEWVRRIHPEGRVNGRIEFHGTLPAPYYTATLSLSHGKMGSLKELTAEFSLTGKGKQGVVSAFRVETPAQRLIASEGLTFSEKGMRGRLRIDRVNLQDILGHESGIQGVAFLDYASDSPGQSSLYVAIDNFRYEKIRLSYLKMKILEKGALAHIQSLTFGNENISGNVSGLFPDPLSVKTPDSDTLNLELLIKGDLLKQAGNLSDFLGNNTRGIGEIRLTFVGNSRSVTIDNGTIDISKDNNAAIRINRIFPGKIEDVKLFLGINHQTAHLEFEGNIRGQKLKIMNDHGIGREAPLVLELFNLDFGCLKIVTEKGGVEVHLPGLMRTNEFGEFEVFDKNGNPGFTLFGPLKNPKLSGILRVNNGRFSFPFLTNAPSTSEFIDQLEWDLTVQAGSNLKYFYTHRQTSSLPFLDKLINPEGLVKKIDRGISGLFEYPLTELTLDKTSVVHFSGRMHNHSFRLDGRVTASQGYIHYAGKDYNQDIDVGVEFNGAEHNLPTIWGSGVAVIRPVDRSKMGSEIKVTMKIKDPQTGVYLTKARFNEFKLVLSSDTYDENGMPIDPYQEMLSGGKESKFGESVTDLARSEGKAMFEKIFLDRMVTQYMERTVLGFSRQTLNPLLGMNVTPDVFRIEIESDRVFNYIDMSVWNFSRLKKDLLENIEFITGKYFLGGTLFLNYSSQFDVMDQLDNVAIEKLHHRVGMELTPWRYLYLNMDYDLGGIPGVMDGNFKVGDVRSNIRLKMPLKKVTNIFSQEHKQEP